MSVFSAFGIIVLAALVHASLQLSLGSLLLIYNSSLGKHVKRKTRVLASNFILGTSLMILLGLAASAFAILSFFGGSLKIETISFVIGVLISASILIWTVYYRSGRSTELWLPRSVSRFVGSRAKVTSSRIETFSLGMLTALAEFPFSLVLVFVAASALLTFSPAYQILGIIIYISIAILPLLVCRFCLKKGNTIVDIQRWRVKNQTFLKVISGIGFLVLACFLFAFKLAGNF